MRSNDEYRWHLMMNISCNKQNKFIIVLDRNQ
jgi:hypothetical protein